MDTKYDELLVQHDKAYRTHLTIYGRENPKPKAPKWWYYLPYIMLPFAFVALAGFTLSATRTGWVFFDAAMKQFGNLEDGTLLSSVEAINAIIVVDLFVIVSRYVLILMHYRKTGKDMDITRNVVFGFIVAFSVAFSANLYSSVRDTELIRPHRSELDLLVAIAVGSSAPLLSFISGDILGILWVNSERKRKEVSDQYKKEMAEYIEARNKSWNARKKDFGISIKDFGMGADSIPSHSNGTEWNGNGTPALGHSKNSNAWNTVWNHFSNNPDDLKRDPREIANDLKVGKSTVYKVRSEFPVTATNGNGKH